MADHKGKKVRPPRDEGNKRFSALREFFSAYLHQDFRDEYGSAAGAARAFRTDARAEELDIVVREWKLWRASLVKSSLGQMQDAVRELGGAWRPEAVDDIDRVGDALRG
jgi:hypothetical protein